MIPGFSLLTPYYCILDRDDRSQVQGFVDKNNTTFKLKMSKSWLSKQAGDSM